MVDFTEYMQKMVRLIHIYFAFIFFYHVDNVILHELILLSFLKYLNIELQYFQNNSGPQTHYYFNNKCIYFNI